MKSVGLFTSLMAGLSIICHAQNSRENIHMVGKEDSQKLIEAYYGPFTKAFGTFNSENWVNHAWPLKFARFNVGVNISTALVPKNFTRYNPAQLGLTTFQSKDESAATFLGSKTLASIERDTMMNGKQQQLQSYKLPDGLGLSVVPYAVPQLNLGIGIGTEVSARWMQVSVDKFNGKYQTFGGSIKHDVFHWISNPNYHLALFGYFSKSTFSLNIKAQPSSSTPNSQNIDFSNQRLIQEFQNKGAGIVFSHDNKGVSLSIGASFNQWESTMKLEGNFPYVILKKDPKTKKDYQTLAAYTPAPLITSVSNSNIFTGATFHGKVVIASIEASYNTYYKYLTVNLNLGLGFMEKATKLHEQEQK